MVILLWTASLISLTRFVVRNITVHAYKTHAYEMHAREVHAYEMHAREVTQTHL
jgi:hypothetical protein